MMDVSEIPEIRLRKDDVIESAADVARILSLRRGRLSFGDIDLTAIKPYIACAAILAGISASNTLPTYRF